MSEDTWVVRARLAYLPRGSSWAHSSFGVRVFLSAWERTGRSIAACFDEEQEFGRLYAALVTEMASECAERGVRFRVLILPGKDDLDEALEAGGGYWAGWSERRRRLGIEVTDLTPALHGAGADHGRLFAPQGHYGPEASAIVASYLADDLRR
jgi:hypothetical protein